MPPKPPQRRPVDVTGSEIVADADYNRIIRVIDVYHDTGAIARDWRGHRGRAPGFIAGTVRIEVPDDGASYAGKIWDRSNGFISGVPDTSSSDQPTMTAVTFRRQFSPEEWQKLRGMLKE